MAITIEKNGKKTERWYELEEFAKLNGCTLQTIYNKINNKEISVKIIFKKKFVKDK
jgi:hypothetical protein